MGKTTAGRSFVLLVLVLVLEIFSKLKDEGQNENEDEEQLWGFGQHAQDAAFPEVTGRRGGRFPPNEPGNIEHPTCSVESFAPCTLSTTSPRPSPPFHGGEGDGKLRNVSSTSQIFDVFYRAHRTSNEGRIENGWKLNA